jgi:ribonuclease HII
VLALPDKNLWIKHNYIAGCDEAGRGPLAGPVVAAAVILPRNYRNPQIDDSKKLTAAQREKLFKIIIRSAVSYAFGIVEHETIDRINILNATKKAMRQAVIGLSPVPEVVLIDAVRIPDLPEEYEQIPLIKGDTLSISIAAASILAKVRRDAIMLEYHKKHPQYHFDRHKGYPTRLHRSCIKEYGPCPIHRKTFKLL